VQDIRKNTQALVSPAWRDPRDITTKVDSPFDFVTPSALCGKHGEFYGEDSDDGRPVKVRFIWDKMDRNHARWEQAFSYDNRTWETNWTADFVRADAAAVCNAGRPKR
jgi:hypothetical protein